MRTVLIVVGEADVVDDVELRVVALPADVRHAGDAGRGREHDPAAIQGVGCATREVRSEGAAAARDVLKSAVSQEPCITSVLTARCVRLEYSAPLIH